MMATLSADHRAVDGVQVAKFLADLRSAVEAPEALFNRSDMAASGG